MIKRKHFDSYWAQTDILKMLDGGKVEVDTDAFQNDLVSFQSKDDILTLLVHLGYLAYHAGTVLYQMKK